jgi:hypothetical protein
MVMLCVTDQKCGVTVAGLHDYRQFYLSCSEYLRLPLKYIEQFFFQGYSINYLVSRISHTTTITTQVFFDSN